MSSLLFKNARIVNEGRQFKGGIFVENDIIKRIYDYTASDAVETESALAQVASEIIDLDWLYVAPGIIDTHVHFREPGNTEKGTIASESAAAALGGVTSYMDMPNNNPPIITLKNLADKFEIADRDSVVNYSFYLGASNANLKEIEAADPRHICALKVFFGSSTGDMLVDDSHALSLIFNKSPLPIVAHCESNAIITRNIAEAKEKYGEDIPFAEHQFIRSREACVVATRQAIELAQKYGTRLHIAHISTAEEVQMLAAVCQNSDLITGEACVGYLYYDAAAYSEFGPLVKCNPSIKSSEDRRVLRQAVADGLIGTIATDHAPHLLNQKQTSYLKSPSGTPYVQYGFLMMLELVKQGVFSLEQVILAMSNNPANCFNVSKRGALKEGYFADLVIFDMERPSQMPAASRCGWAVCNSFSSSVVHTISNGRFVVKDGHLTGVKSASSLIFER
ncbi:MAG: amidohydrolase family protein [Bacteroidales bacterium]|nr:amidohydrolase family protein [Bacteroidales bacterium]